MRILIYYDSGVPIYEQIKAEIRAQIMRGELPPDTLLPSIRMLAKELQIGIITAKRAYDDLCAEGLLYSVQGKGVFVAKLGIAKAQEGTLDEIRARLEEVFSFAERNSVDRAEIKKLINEIWEE